MFKVVRRSITVEIIEIGLQGNRTILWVNYEVFARVFSGESINVSNGREKVLQEIHNYKTGVPVCG